MKIAQYTFKPNLIPNGKIPWCNINLKDYYELPKKDGVRVELYSTVLGRSLKPCPSSHYVNKFKHLAERCEELGVVLEGEFYSHGMTFKELNRFYKTDLKKNKQLEVDMRKYNISGTVDTPVWLYVPVDQITPEMGKSKLAIEWPGRTPEWLSTYHNIKIHVFDVFVSDRPKLAFEDRIKYIKDTFSEYSHLIVLPTLTEVSTKEEALELYHKRLEEGYEGSVLVHKRGIYKRGRSTLREGTYFKLKDDSIEFDGVVLDVEEATVVREGTPKTINELGRSVTSKLKEDRIPSGIAKGFVTEYKGHKHTVSLKGFDVPTKRELFINKSKYIGKHFKYTGMPPTKYVPRHAFFKEWRDEK